jgi:hypothetical protein
MNITKIHVRSLKDLHTETIFIKIDYNGNISIRSQKEYYITDGFQKNPICDILIIKDYIPIPSYIINMLSLFLQGSILYREDYDKLFMIIKETKQRIKKDKEEIDLHIRELNLKIRELENKSLSEEIYEATNSPCAELHAWIDYDFMKE